MYYLKRKKGSLDNFFFKEVAGKYKHLPSTLELVLVLNHGQASAQRTFRVSSIVVTNFYHLTKTYNPMKNSSLSPQIFPVTKSLLNSVKSVLQYYIQYPKKEESKNQENEQSAQVEFFLLRDFRIKKTNCQMYWHYYKPQ